MNREFFEFKINAYIYFENKFPLKFEFLKIISNNY